MATRCANAGCGKAIANAVLNIAGQLCCPECGQPVADVQSLQVPDRSENETPFAAGSVPNTIPPSESTEFPPLFGRYRIISRLGQGGMGTVYLAHDPQLDRQVALKVPHFAAEDSPDLRARFLREARAAATIQHPNVCPVYDVGDADGVPYFTMAFIEGKSLDAIARGKALPPRTAAVLMRKIALAVEEAHCRGIVHRDLKPSNVMINRRKEPIVMDFGLAQRREQGDGRLTKAGIPLGTPAFMSPEQVRGDTNEIGPRSDVYSMGVMLYELLTGRLPFEGPPTLVMGLILVQEPVPPTRHRADLNPGLASVCLKAMAKKPEDRYTSARDVAEALSEFVGHADSRSGASATDAPSENAVRERVRPRRWSFLVSAVAVIVVVLSIMLFFPEEHGTIGIEFSPEAAPDMKVEVDGDEVSLNGPTVDLRLKPGEHRLLVKSKDFEPYATTFNVKSGTNDLIRVELQPLPGRDLRVAITGKSSVPDAKSISVEKAKIYEAIRTELATNKKEERVKLAQSFIKRAQETAATETVQRYCLLEVAGEIALRAGESNVAMQAADHIFQTFAADPLRVKTNIVRAAHRERYADKAIAEVVADTALTIGFEAISLDAYADAKLAAKVAKEIADQFKEPYLVYQSGLLDDDLARAERGFVQVRDSISLLREQPDNPVASSAVGEFYCFAKNEWDKGLPLLVRGANEQLRNLATRELKAPENANDQVALGDAWWDFSERERESTSNPYKTRAKYWYLKGLAKTEHPQRAELAKRLVPRIDKVPSRPVMLQIRQSYYGEKTIRISSDGISVQSDQHLTKGRINHVEYDQMSGLKPNHGRTRIMPDVVDFSTANIVQEWAHGYGGLALKFEADGLVIRVLNKTITFIDFGMTITLESDRVALSNRLSAAWDVKFYSWTKSDNHDYPINWEQDVQGKPIDSRNWDRIDFRACDDSFKVRFPPPTDKVPHDRFGLVAKTTFDVPRGVYEIRTLSDDGIRVFVDDNKVIDLWKPGGGQLGWAKLELDGVHRVRVEYFQCTGWARLQFALQRLGDK